MGILPPAGLREAAGLNAAAAVGAAALFGSDVSLAAGGLLTDVDAKSNFHDSDHLILKL